MHKNTQWDKQPTLQSLLFLITNPKLWKSLQINQPVVLLTIYARAPPPDITAYANFHPVLWDTIVQQQTDRSHTRLGAKNISKVFTFIPNFYLYL